MTASKLESLPNEVLVHTFEEYINGVDILVAFLHHQNQRFDALISQCQQFKFDFLYCRKDDFYACIGLLPAYVERIEELALSDQHTPGQIRAFLSFCPSFTAFKRLRKFYFHYNAETIDWSLAQSAFRSLSNTTVETVSIEAANTDGVQIKHFMVDDILRLSTIKRFFLSRDFRRDRWDSFYEDTWKFTSRISSTIEYLTIFSEACRFCHLKSIFECAPQLKYLNVRLSCTEFYRTYPALNSQTNSINSIPTLHTLILAFEMDDSTTFDMLAQHLRVMPALRRLEIKAHRALLDASAWESLLQTSLPLLTQLHLQTTTSRIPEADIDFTLASFDTPFWISKQNFYMILTKHLELGYNGFGMHETHINQQHEFNRPSIKWWIVPFHHRIDVIPTSGITSFGMSGSARSLSSYYYFKNVKNLVVHNLNAEFLEWLIDFVNYSQIKYLDVSSLNGQYVTIISLLSCVQNISFLRIRYIQLLELPDVYLGKTNYLKFLDISVDEHSFDEKDINVISTLFPDIEHLAINTRNLSNISSLTVYLPHLISLTYKTIEDDGLFYKNYRQNFRYYRSQELANLSSAFKKSWLTIWIDHAALQDFNRSTISSNMTE